MSEDFAFTRLFIPFLFAYLGFAYNGLQWRRKEKKLLKYDFTSDFEQKTIWKHFRLRE